MFKRKLSQKITFLNQGWKCLPYRIHVFEERIFSRHDIVNNRHLTDTYLGKFALLIFLLLKNLEVLQYKPDVFLFLCSQERAD